MIEQSKSFLDNFSLMKVKSDGTNFIATRQYYQKKEIKENLKRKEKPYYKEFKILYYKAINSNIKKFRFIVNFMIEEFKKDNQTLSNQDINTYARLYTSLIIKNNNQRLKRFKDKAYLNKFNYFCTFTYDSKKIKTSEQFKKKILKSLQNLSSRYNIKYMLVFENGEKTERCHAHALLNIPKECFLLKQLKKNNHYDLTRGTINNIIECEYFSKVFGRNDFKPITWGYNTNIEILNYILKYVVKSENKIHYSKHLPSSQTQFIANKDIITSYEDSFGNIIYVLNIDSPFQEERFKIKALYTYNDMHNLFNFDS